jgi:hypothetical protein
VESLYNFFIYCTLKHSFPLLDEIQNSSVTDQGWKKNRIRNENIFWDENISESFATLLRVKYT